MNAFEQIKTELINRGWDGSEADAQAAGYTRTMDDSQRLSLSEVKTAADQIENMD